jgi:hypothetical protein
MFYLLKHLSLPYLVILKPRCNNLIFNEIMILNASYVCLHAFSLCRESPDLYPGRWPLISEVVLSHKVTWILADCEVGTSRDISPCIKRSFVERWYSPSTGMDWSEWKIILEQLLIMGLIVKEEVVSETDD